MASIAEALSLALQHHQAGRLSEAEAIYRQILQVQPNHSDALHLLGVIAHQVGRHDVAVDYINKAIALNPRIAEYHNNLGEAYRVLGKLDKAAAHYQEALTLKPVFADPHNNVGIVFKEQGKLEEAVAYYRQALALKPDYAEAYNNLGNALREQGKLDEAVAQYRQALALKPGYAEAHNNRGAALKEQGKLDEAVAQYRQALVLKPTYAEAHSNLGTVLKDLGKIEEAEACFRRALAIQPGDGLKIKLATMLPVILPSLESVAAIRKRFEENIDALLKEELTLKDPIKEVGQANFYLAYQGYNDRELQMKIARLYERACPALSYTAPHCAAPTPSVPNGKIKVGFISKFLYSHSVAMTSRGIMANLSREKFSVYAICVPPVKQDNISALVDKEVDHKLVLPVSLEDARRRIAKEELDILVYLDIGMEPFTYFLAFSRLAPVQCVYPGHPVTTGIGTIDYFISSEHLELKNADEHYSERLVCLTHLPTYYYRPGIPASAKSKKDYGLDEKSTVYLCPQALFKFHPEFDEVMANILRADPNGFVVLVEGHERHWTQLMRDRLERSIPGLMARVRFLLRMNVDDFLRLLTISDVVLDTIHFGGGTTSLMSLGMGTPVVTLPGQLMRGRVTYGCYKQMGLMDCVAKSPEQYVKIAVRLGTDAAYRKKISAKILANNNVFYENLEVVREFERFFIRAVKDAKKGSRKPSSGGARTKMD